MFVLPLFRIYEKSIVEKKDCADLLDRDIGMENVFSQASRVSLIRVFKWELPNDYYKGFLNRLFSSPSLHSVNSFLKETKPHRSFCVPLCVFHRFNFPKNCTQESIEKEIEMWILEIEECVSEISVVFFVVEILDFFSDAMRQQLVQKIKKKVFSKPGFAGFFYLNFISQQSQTQLPPLQSIVRDIQDKLVQEDQRTSITSRQKDCQTYGVTRALQKKEVLDPKELLKMFFQNFFLLQIFGLGGESMACSVLARYFSKITDLLMKNIIASVPGLAELKTEHNNCVGTEFLRLCVETYLEVSEYPQQSWQTRCIVLLKCAEHCREVFCFSPKAVYFLEPFLKETEKDDSLFLEKFSFFLQPFLHNSKCTGVDFIYNTVEKNVFFASSFEHQKNAHVAFFWTLVRATKGFKKKLSQLIVILNVKKLVRMYQKNELDKPFTHLDPLIKEILEKESCIMRSRTTPFAGIANFQKMNSFLKKGQTDMALGVFEGTSVPLLSTIVQKYHETFPDLLNYRKKIGVWSITYIFTVVKILVERVEHRYPLIQKNLEIFLERTDSNQTLSWSGQIGFLKEILTDILRNR